MNLDRQAVDEHEDSDEFVNLNMDVEVVPNVLPSLPGQALLDDVVNLKKGKFCGLRNLGATCYLNTFIQVSLVIVYVFYLTDKCVFFL